MKRYSISALAATALLLAALALSGCTDSSRPARPSAVPTAGADSTATVPLPPVEPDEIAYVRDDHVWRAHADGSSAVQLTSTKGVDVSPAWSPDRQHVVFVNDPNPDSYPDTQTVGVVPAAGGPVRFYGMDMLVEDVTYSPDGTRIAAIGSLVPDPDSGEEWQIKRLYVIDIAAETSTVVWELRDLFATGMTVAWSPDGDRLLIGESMQDAEDQRIGILTLATGKTSWLKIPDASEAHWSPDGKSIVVNQTPQTFTTLLIAGVNGKSRRVLARGGGWDMPKRPVYGGSFSPDGQRVAYYDDSSVWVIGRNGKGKRKVLSNASMPAWCSW